MTAQQLPLFGGANHTADRHSAVHPAFGGAVTSTANATSTAAAQGGNPFAGAAQSHTERKRASAPKPQSFPLTEEQKIIRDGFIAGHDMVVSAGAGTGKTSTITMLAEEMYKDNPTSRGVYLAFNTSIKDEVKSKLFYGNVNAMTVHSLANRGIRSDPRYAPLMDKLGRSYKELMSKFERPKAFGAKSRYQFGENNDPIHPSRNPALYEIVGSTACAEAVDTITKWCQSDDDAIEPKHVPVTSNIDKRVRPQYRAVIADLAQKMWDTDIMSPHGRLKFSHDHYLKLYSMMGMSIVDQLGITSDRAVLFFDEAQDSRPCITKIVMSQQGRMQIVLCGDSSQAIYRFTGSRDAIRGFKKYDTVKNYTLSKTFRFGADIAKLANSVLSQIDGSDVRIVPNLDIDSKVHQYDGNVSPARVGVGISDETSAVICRSNGQLIETAMDLLNQGYRVFCATDTALITGIAESYFELQHGRKATHHVMKQFTSAAAVERLVKKTTTKQFLNDEDDDDDEIDDEIDPTVLSIIRTVVFSGPTHVLEAMENVESVESDADVSISTIHKAKGRQWDTVSIVWDHTWFARNHHSRQFNDELMLLYVAVTRARHTLNLPSGLLTALSILLPNNSRQFLTLREEFMGDDMREARDLASVYTDTLLGDVSNATAKARRILEDILEDGLEPHHMVKALVFVQEKYLGNTETSRNTRGYVIATFLAAIGISNILEIESMSDSGIPDELLAAMISPREEAGLSSGDLKVVGEMLNPR